jgi:hypothetical protein
MDKITIRCKTEKSILLDDLQEFQGDLKARTEEDIDLLKKSIIKYGFSFPFFVWVHEKTNWCMDGHGRILALKQLRDEGYELPQFPVAYVKAENEEEAKQKLLRLNSSFGTITRYGLQNFIGTLDIDLSELRLTDGYVDFTKSVFSEGGEFSTAATGYNMLRFKDYKIPMTEQENMDLKEAVEIFAKERGNSEGFFGELVSLRLAEKIVEAGNTEGNSDQRAGETIEKQEVN